MQGCNIIGYGRGLRALLIMAVLAVSLGCLPAVGADSRHSYNFDGPGATDVGIYGGGRFWFYRGSSANLESYPLGGPGDVPFVADFDGDGRTDFCLYNTSTRTFHWVRSSDGVSTTLTTGNWGDIPIAIDFDGDGKSDFGIYRPEDAIYWFTLSSNNQLVSSPIGQRGDLPITGDFDGDGHDELGVFTPSTATFMYHQSSNGALVQIQLGQPGDVPLVGDYDGDGKIDLAVYHSPTSTFTYRRASTGQTVSTQFGQHGDTPMVGDYDGDGKADIAVFRPQAGAANVILYLASSTAQTVSIPFGNPADTPLGARFAPAEQTTGLTYTNLPQALQLQYWALGVPHTDKNGRIQSTLDANSFFPRCIAGTWTTDFSAVAAGGFNCAIPWNGYTPAQPLAAAHAAGLQVIESIQQNYALFTGGGGTFSPNPNCPLTADPNNPLSSNPICQARYAVQAVANDSALLAWGGEDEPTGCATTSQCSLRETIFTSLKNQVAAVDQTHPLFFVDLPPPTAASVGDWSWWNHAPAVVSNDNYPFIGISAAPPNTLAPSAAAYQQLVSAAGQTKPVWIMPQAFSGGGTTFSWSWPNATNLRAEVFTALIHGATGILDFIYDNSVARGNCVVGIAPSPQLSYGSGPSCPFPVTANDLTSSQTLWNEAVALNAEMGRLQNVLLSPTWSTLYNVGSQGTSITATPIRTLMKLSSSGTLTLLMVNVDNVPLNVQVTLPSRPVDLYSISSDGARSPMTPYNNTIMDSIEGFGVRIYEFK